MSQLTTHILDTSKGKPAKDVAVTLCHKIGNDWKHIAHGFTNSDGRVPHLIDKEMSLQFGIYKLKFEIAEYFERQGIHAFYPYIEIVFDIHSTEHYHVPLLLNPFGYSTYRGS